MSGAGVPVDLPETRDLFYPSEPQRVDGGLRVGRDLEASIIVLDSGPVLARIDDTSFFVNTSLEQYRRTLVDVGEARDKMALEPENDRLVVELELRLREHDPAALEEPGSYWSMILEGIRDNQF
jgi:hypothetical protein